MFAGFVEHTDNQVGRLRDALEEIGELDNTLFIYIAGDNGTSAEGGFVGMYNEMTYFNGVVEKVEDLIPLIDKWGGPETFPHMAAGWAVAGAILLGAPALASFYDEPGLTHLLRLIGCSYLLVPFAIVSAALLVRDMDFKGLFWVNAGSALAGNMAAIMLAWDGYGPASLAWGALVTAIVRAGVAQAMRPVLPRLRPRRAIIAPLLRFGSSSFLISASAAIGQRSQDLIVGRLLGAFATGLFSRAGALAAQLSTLVTGAINSVFYPAFARKRDAGEPLTEPYLHLMACNTALNWAAMCGLAVAAEPLVRLLYGENWMGVAPLLFWTAIGEMLFVAMPLQMDIPILLGRIRTLVWVNLGETLAAVTILAVAAAISLEAAAISRVGYGFVWWAIYAAFLTRLLALPVRRLFTIYGQSALCAVAACLPLYLLLHVNDGRQAGFLTLIIGAAAGVALWLPALFLTRHPAHLEVRIALAALMARWPRPASA